MKKSFTGKLRALDDPGSANLGWRVVDVPFDVKKTFGKGGRLPVRGEVNGFAFRTSIFPRKEGKHYLLMNKKMQQGANATSLGAKLTLTIEHDVAKRTVQIPTVLKDAFEQDKELLAYFSSLNYSTRKFMVDMIESPKSSVSKRRQAERIAEIVLEMMEGERTPPPILEAEFVRNPKTRKGWEKMTVSQKRGHLWGIFYYRNPVSRMKRLKKAIDEMVKYSEK
ncbi:MAG TPA: YdeI/OmpD-associated family protein [Candidatus Kapabacteria bacterium]